MPVSIVDTNEGNFTITRHSAWIIKECRIEWRITRSTSTTFVSHCIALQLAAQWNSSHCICCQNNSISDVSSRGDALIILSVHLVSNIYSSCILIGWRPDDGSSWIYAHSRAWWDAFGPNAGNESMICSASYIMCITCVYHVWMGKCVLALYSTMHCVIRTIARAFSYRRANMFIHVWYIWIDEAEDGQRMDSRARHTVLVKSIVVNV